MPQAPTIDPEGSRTVTTAELRTAPFGRERKSSDAQIQASRNNGKKSRGPKTLGGKAISALNATRHGAYARPVAVPRGPFQEIPQQVTDYASAIQLSLKPKNAAAEAAALEVAAACIRLRRLDAVEANQMAAAGRDTAGQDDFDEHVTLVMAHKLAAGLLRLPIEEVTPDGWSTAALLLRRYDEELGRLIAAAEKRPDDELDWQGWVLEAVARHWESVEDAAECLEAEGDNLRAAACESARRSAEQQEEHAAEELLDPLDRLSTIRSRLIRDLNRALGAFNQLQQLP